MAKYKDSYQIGSSSFRVRFSREQGIHQRENYYILRRRRRAISSLPTCDSRSLPSLLSLFNGSTSFLRASARLSSSVTPLNISHASTSYILFTLHLDLSPTFLHRRPLPALSTTWRRQIRITRWSLGGARRRGPRSGSVESEGS